MHKKALLVISFGTSYAETLEKTIAATEKALGQQFPQYDIKRAFSSQMVINKLKKRDHLEIDTIAQAAERLLTAGYREILAQPLHIIHGSEYHAALTEFKPYVQHFARVAFGRPLLSLYADYLAVVDALRDELPVFKSAEALIFMGHGSSHPANAAYAQLDMVFKDQGFPHIHVATVEGFPGLTTVIKHLKADHVQKVTLMPFMLVAGDHACNDMAGDGPQSWKTILQKEGFAVVTRLVGLGEMEKIRQLYINHAQEAEGK